MSTLAIQNNTTIMLWYGSFKNSLLWTTFTKNKATAFKYKYKMTWQNKYLYLQPFKMQFQGICSIRLGSIFFSSHVYAMRSIETCECFKLGLMMVLMRIQKLWIVSGSAPVAQSGCAQLNNGHKKKKGFRGKEFGLPIFCPVDIRPILNVRKMSICLPYERVIWTSYEPLISVVWPLGSL